MRFIILSLALITSLSIAGSAQAEPKWSSWFGWDHGFGSRLNHANFDFSPYMDDPAHSHPVYNENTDWQPSHWVDQLEGRAEEFIERGYRGQIIHKQDTRDGVPVLVVGPNFYMLSAYDQRRYVRTIDYIYSMTASAPHVMMVRDWKSGAVVGAVDKQLVTFQ
jgi:hypothetical protein